MDEAAFDKAMRLRKGSEGAVTEIMAELATERAENLARLHRRLERALARIGEPDARREFLTARWELLVVKEAMGLRGVRAELDRDWPIPPIAR